MNIDGSIIANYVNALDAQINFSSIQSAGDEIEIIYEACLIQRASWSMRAVFFMPVMGIGVVKPTKLSGLIIVIRFLTIRAMPDLQAR